MAAAAIATECHIETGRVLRKVHRTFTAEFREDSQKPDKNMASSSMDVDALAEIGIVVPATAATAAASSKVR
jgi:hypothetical protein